MIKLKYILPLLTILLSTAVTLLTPFVANASSVYDSILQNATSPYQVYNSSYPPGTSYATSYDIGAYLGSLDKSAITASSSGNCSSGTTQTDYIYDAIQNIAAGHPYFIVQYVSGSNKSLMIYVEQSSTATITFDWYSSGYVYAHSSDATFTNFTISTRTSGANSLCYQGNNSSDVPLYSSGGYFYIASNQQFTYPTGYAGYMPTPESSKISVYPGMSILVEDDPQSDNSKVKLIFADSWADFLKNHSLNPPTYSIFTLTDMSDNIIVSDRCWGPTGCDWNALPLGDYKAYLNVVYTDTSVTDVYDFKTTEVWFQVNNTSYTMLYNSKEGKYCSVRGGYEWNCTIPQPGDTPSLITGDPETWTSETCSITDLGACVRNILHYIGEYLGINGPAITAGSSPFFQFDTNTFGLTSILTAPITILTNLSTAEYTCTAVIVPLPFIDSNLTLPCMNSYYTTYMGSLYTIWQTVINGIVSYWVIVNLLKMVKDAKDPQKDQIEVLKL